MKSRNRLLLAAALVGGLACGEGDSSNSLVVVTVVASPGMPPVSQLRVTVSNAPETGAAKTDTELLPQSTSPTPLTFDATFALSIPKSRSGNLDIVVDALDATGGLVATGSGAVAIVVGGRANLTISLGAPGVLDAGVPDSGARDSRPETLDAPLDGSSNDAVDDSRGGDTVRGETPVTNTGGAGGQGGAGGGIDGGNKDVGVGGAGGGGAGGATMDGATGTADTRDANGVDGAGGITATGGAGGGDGGRDVGGAGGGRDANGTGGVGGTGGGTSGVGGTGGGTGGVGGTGGPDGGTGGAGDAGQDLPPGACSTTVSCPSYPTCRVQPTCDTATGICSQPSQCSVCGNSILEFSEQCDDGNTKSGDHCSSACKTEYCGDGIIQSNALAGLTLIYLARTCGLAVTQDIWVVLNGVEVLRSVVPQTCDCEPGIVTLPVTNPDFLALGFTGGNVVEVHTHAEISWAVIHYESPAGPGERSFINYGGSGAAQDRWPNLCTVGSQQGGEVGMTIILAGGEQCDHGSKNGTTGDSCSISCLVQ